MREMSRRQRHGRNLGTVYHYQLSLDWITFIPRGVANINREKENFLLLCADVACGFGSNVFMVRGISETCNAFPCFAIHFLPEGRRGQPRSIYLPQDTFALVMYPQLGYFGCSWARH